MSLHARSRALTIVAPLIGVATLLAGANGACTATSSGDDGARGGFGKADNYYSDVSFEFEVTGTVPVEMSESEYADEEARHELVQRRLSAVGLYLTTFVTDKFRGIDIDGNGTIDESEIFFHNEAYGGFHAMVRNYTVEPVEVTGDAGAYSVKFAIDLAGPKDFLRLVPQLDGVEIIGENSAAFAFQMPKGATSDPESIDRRQIRRFDPSQYDGEIEDVECVATRLPEPANAYPEYAAFMEDGTYDITLFFGHDYNAERSDIPEAKEAFSVLTGALGFDAPDGVSSFDDLGAESGPFTKQIEAGGQPVQVEVRIFHSDMWLTDRPAQKQKAIDEIVTRDVFFYNGHAGPYYGFYLDANDQAKINHTEFRDFPFTEKKQLFIAQGCQTYSQYADMVYAHPLKDENNFDVITTVNYSYGRGTIGVLRNLVATERGPNHVPVTFHRIVGDLNRDWINSNYQVFYGVTGMDGNPQLHPYANLEKLGSSCSADSDCGDFSGNVCAANGGDQACVVRALAAAACPSGTSFAAEDAAGAGYCGE